MIEGRLRHVLASTLPRSRGESGGSARVAPRQCECVRRSILSRVGAPHAIRAVLVLARNPHPLCARLDAPLRIPHAEELDGVGGVEDPQGGQPPLALRAARGDDDERAREVSHWHGTSTAPIVRADRKRPPPPTQKSRMEAAAAAAPVERGVFVI